MIAIKRPDAPPFLLDTEEKWHEETENAIAHYEANTPGAFKFEMYNDIRLKNELKKVFKKCAYCESAYQASSDGDVEHFRPKGRVTEKNPQTPGYYWLANDWENLFLACQHCNQRRKHQLDGNDALEALGKVDQFPLSDETKRISSHLNHPNLADEDEVRLLLNPCKDDPDEL